MAGSSNKRGVRIVAIVLIIAMVASAGTALILAVAST